jgi:uncharacterized protein (TIGR02001 family)
MKHRLMIAGVSAVLAGGFASPAAFAQVPGGQAGSDAASSTAAAPSAVPADPIVISANVGLFSDYRFRGISQTGKKPAIQGGFDLTHESGLYIGTWASNISWLSDTDSRISAPIEWDLYGGYRGEIVKGVTFDVGGLQYYYPGTYPDGFVRPHTFELYGRLGYGPFTLKYSHALTNLFGFN